MPAQSRSKGKSCSGSWAGKMLVPIQEKMKGCWSELFSSKLSFSPSAFPADALTAQGRMRGCSAACPPPHGMACCFPRAEPWTFCGSGKCGRIQHSLPSLTVCLLCAAHASLPLQGKPCQLMNPQAELSNIPFAKRTKEVFLIITLWLVFLVFFFPSENASISGSLENRILCRLTALTKPISLPSDQALGSAGLVLDAAPGGARSGSCLLLPESQGSTTARNNQRRLSLALL